MSARVPVKRRACVACTAAKAKCTPQAADLCQRCARLGKACTYLDLPQTKRKHKVAPSRVDVLEKKVDQLMSQLATLTQHTVMTPSDTLNPPTHDSASSHDPDLDSVDTDALHAAAQDPSHGPDPPTTSAMEGQPTIVDRGLLSEAEAERLVTSFQLDFIPKFPFVLLGSGETAESLRRTQPFLFLCIVAATIGSASPLRKIVADEIMKHVTMRIVARSERNLELLRGLLVHSAWYSYPGEKNHPRLLLLIQFVVSISQDLGLHKKTNLTLDEQRALLGTYWLSSSLHGSLGRLTSMSRDIQIDRCTWGLSSTEQIPDRWIAPFIQIQSFLATLDDVHASIQPSGGTVQVQVMHGCLLQQFNNLKASVEKDLAGIPSSTENAIRTELKYTEVRLEELCLREELWTMESTHAVRITMLMNMIQRSKELIHTIRNLRISEISQMTISTSARLCIGVGYIPTLVFTLLNLITGPIDSSTESQAQAVIDMADYPSLVTELANTLDVRFEGMSTAEKETDVVGSLCNKMRQLARSYPYQVRNIIGNALSQDARQDVSMGEVPPNDVAMASTVWPSIYGDLDGIFPIDDIQWDSLLRSFTEITSTS
ncbi:transcriptional regulator family: Fungal Specific TF [Penicillium psychrosexuale]|uniref:transcriptional regulator family: Fungal Specific TF n=1 Tax=Penicillium psychrosexuale TaxID=1002107 RepID=UPI002545B824|nr:transcriptional regulator family: Fungal Specific TF [Penicillium psychrosexuale]KAJ5795635.1 transcriptional regulator family: Fungal Specific TF [Penicillium psychrosexuale]